jgi:hypothetical protein
MQRRVFRGAVVEQASYTVKPHVVAVAVVVVVAVVVGVVVVVAVLV